jgi:hypothetical protein
MIGGAVAHDLTSDSWRLLDLCGGGDGSGRSAQTGQMNRRDEPWSNVYVRVFCERVIL